ncbi:TVP38/TMEM64 family protein [Jannaschia rubra]|uniref:TVP38/TMEM64 family membrane protein n=1 Tax=Jannaschia rubra TaxID=282197 RepID=A0A0M6XSK2_9RHOB|nr:VTT domain-containing protein [Jannaschia rubra]CTQ33024.1 TVP38/TMEM64 family inner membrane protein YdjZ [Jannaschia rubra]SFG58450.1 Uncharacterized membrane protein YdjX, TVP38/TMEM64 family, SNARE-associated domain [Jannaschia rubra]
MTSTAPPDSIRTWHLWLWPLLLVAIAFAMWLLPWGDWVPMLRDWVDSHGPLGVVVFLVAYVVVVILPLPAAAMSVVGGLAFGWWGFPLSMLGSILGAVPPYLVGRYWLRDPMMRRMAGPRMHAADRAIGQNAMVFVGLLRLTPILPFTAQNWLLGLTSVRLAPYVVASTLGLAPGTLAMVWIGEMGGLATVGTSRVQLALAGFGLLGFGLLVLWLARFATTELRRAGFHGAAVTDK